jgi:hypothetical protein
LIVAHTLNAECCDARSGLLDPTLPEAPFIVRQQGESFDGSTHDSGIGMQ